MVKYSLEKAAEYLGCSTRTLRRWEESKKLVPLYNANNNRFYTDVMLKDFEQGVYSFEKQSKYTEGFEKPFSFSVNLDKLEKFIEEPGHVVYILSNTEDISVEVDNLLLSVSEESYGFKFTVGLYEGDKLNPIFSWKELS